MTTKITAIGRFVAVRQRASSGTMSGGLFLPAAKPEYITCEVLAIGAECEFVAAAADDEPMPERSALIHSSDLVSYAVIDGSPVHFVDERKIVAVLKKDEP